MMGRQGDARDCSRRMTRDERVAGTQRPAYSVDHRSDVAVAHLPHISRLSARWVPTTITSALHSTDTT